MLSKKVEVALWRTPQSYLDWGRDVQRTISLCVEKGLKRPEISEIGMFVKFVFYRESDAKSDTKSDTKSDANYYDAILHYLKEKDSISINDAISILSLKSQGHPIFLEQW